MLSFVAFTACDSTPARSPLPIVDSPGNMSRAQGLVELPACATTGSATGGTALLYPRRALPAVLPAGTSIELRVRMARSLMPAPGVQRSRALWGWSIRIEARGQHALGVREGDAAARRPAIRYALRVSGVRADDSLSLVYRVQVEVPLEAVPATYDLVVRRPGVTVREPLALRVLTPGRETRLVRGGALERAQLDGDLSRWSRGGADVVVVTPSAAATDAEQVVERLAALERSSPTALLVLPPRGLSRPAAWADAIAATGYGYAIDDVVHTIGRCVDGRAGPMGSAGGERGARAGDSLIAGPVGSLVGSNAPLRGAARAPVAGRDERGASVLDAGDPDTVSEVLVALRRNERLRCDPMRCKTVALGVSPDAFTAPSDAATAIVVSLPPGPTVRLSATPSTRATLTIAPSTSRVAAGASFELTARTPRGMQARRVLWALAAPPSAEWANDEQPSAEGQRLRHRIRAPGTHDMRAIAIADDGRVASGAAVLEVTAAAATGCVVPAGSAGAVPRRESPWLAPGLLLALLCSCFISRRRNAGGHGGVADAHVPSARFVSRLGRCRVRHLEHPEHRRRGHRREPRGHSGL